MAEETVELAAQRGLLEAQTPKSNAAYSYSHFHLHYTCSKRQVSQKFSSLTT
jgi:hypothetical protein